MGAVSTGEIPLLSSFLYLFDGAEAGRRPSLGVVRASAFGIGRSPV